MERRPDQSAGVGQRTTAVAGAGAGASPLAGGNLATTDPSATLAYDVADRHVSTTLDDGTVVIESA